MVLRRVFAVVALGAALAGTAGTAAAQEVRDPVPGSGHVDVLEVDGPLDELAVDFLISGIETSDAQLVVVQLDAQGAVTGDVAPLIDLMANPPLPVAVWVGPDPADGYGGASQLLAAASIRSAAPGARVGYLEPMVAGGERSGASDRFPDVPGELMDDSVVVDGPIPGLVDLVQPSVGQLIVAIDGMVVELESGSVQLQTARQSEDPGTGPAPAVEVRFDKGSLFSRVFRVAIRPEAAYLFLVVGIALAVFEFYAAGVGVMAAVAVLALLVGGYGVVALPVRWWAVGMTLVGLGLYTADFQRHDLGWRSILGTAALLAGGLWFVDAAPQFGINWWAVLGVVAGAALFFGVGMTAVVRSRFSTATIGRDHLIGRVGAAATDFDPAGVVDLDGARWRATSRRAAGIEEGDDVEVIAVSGIVLEVEPANLTDVRE